MIIAVADFHQAEVTIAVMTQAVGARLHVETIGSESLLHLLDELHVWNRRPR
ncbi:MAG: hypothetical protein QM796_13250 [Chthoniobacteraceae bacterium]